MEITLPPIRFVIDLNAPIPAKASPVAAASDDDTETDTGDQEADQQPTEAPRLPPKKRPRNVPIRKKHKRRKHANTLAASTATVKEYLRAHAKCKYTIQALASNLSLDKRRLYDILGVMHGMGVVDKNEQRPAPTYQWIGE